LLGFEPGRNLELQVRIHETPCVELAGPAAFGFADGVLQLAGRPEDALLVLLEHFFALVLGLLGALEFQLERSLLLGINFGKITKLVK
jgi:hypothetical protein